MTGYESVVPSGAATGGTEVVGDYSEPSGWFNTGVFAGTLTPELKEVISNTAADIGMNEGSFYLMLMIGVTIAVGFGVLLFTGNVMITLLVVSILLIVISGTEVVHYALVFIAIVLMFGTYYLLKQR